VEEALTLALNVLQKMRIALNAENRTFCKGLQSQSQRGGLTFAAITTSYICNKENPYLSSIQSKAPHCLQASVIGISINGHNAEALMDSGSSGSFADTKVCKKLGIKYIGKANEVTMASTTQAVRIHGEVKENLKVADETYERITLGVMDNLCADIILGLDFMKMHDGVQFNLRGRKNLLQIDFGKAILFYRRFTRH